jgi:hypothetical protein
MPSIIPANEPILADVQAPWDRTGSVGWWEALKGVGKTFAYTRRYGFYWAPASLDRWRYRRFLRDLDAICLRTLDSHGALSATELTDWLNQEKLLRTKPDLTGIQRISVATTHDWLDLANRRGLVAPFFGASVQAGWTSRSSRRQWELTDRGREHVRARFLALVSRLPLGATLTGIGSLIFGGGLLAAIKWLSVHEVLGLMLAITGVGIYIGALFVYFNRSQKKEGPGLAVVAIETVRSAGRPIPVLGGR